MNKDDPVLVKSRCGGLYLYLAFWHVGQRWCKFEVRVSIRPTVSQVWRRKVWGFSSLPVVAGIVRIGLGLGQECGLKMFMVGFWYCPLQDLELG